MSGPFVDLADIVTRILNPDLWAAQQMEKLRAQHPQAIRSDSEPMRPLEQVMRRAEFGLAETQEAEHRQFVGESLNGPMNQQELRRMMDDAFNLRRSGIKQNKGQL